MTVLIPLIAFTLMALAIDSTQALAIPLVIAGWGLLLGASTPWAGRRHLSPRIFKVLLVVGAALLTLKTALSGLVRDNLPEPYHWCFVAATALIGLIIADYLFDRQATRRLRFSIFVLLHTALGAWAILAFPEPGIDVWHFQHRAAETLLSGEHPYGISMPNPYPHDHLFGPEVLRDGKVHGFPYPPLSLLLVLPGYLLGDVRWVMLAAHLVLAWTMVAIARRRGFRAGHPVELIALAMLVQPASLLIVQLAWTDALFATAMGLLVYVCLLEHALWRPLALTAAWSIKQYSILLPWSEWRSGAFRFRDFVLAGALTAGIMAPFFLWGTDETWFSIVEFQFHQPTRPDSASLNAILLHGESETLPRWFSLACVIVVSVWVSSSRSAIRTNIALTSAAVLLTLFVTTNAFINYLWTTSALLAIGTIVAFPAAERHSRTMSSESIPIGEVQ